MARWPDFEVSPGGIVKVDNLNSGALTPDKDQALTDFLSEDKEVAETFAVWLYDGRADIGMQIRIHPTGDKDVGLGTHHASGWSDPAFGNGGRSRLRPSQGRPLCHEPSRYSLRMGW